MALPGLNLTDSLARPATPSSDVPPRTIQLSAGSELRFEVSFNHTLNIKLLAASNTNEPTEDTEPAGTAEVNGTELAPTQTYSFSGAKTAIFTYHGCSLEVSGGLTESEYVAEETNVMQYANVHFALEHLREQASADLARAASGAEGIVGGPRVLVVGPESAGKTSLVKTLTAYATKEGRSPCVVNLDPREGLLCPPGCLSAAVFGPGNVLDVADTAGCGWGTSPVAGPSAQKVTAPVVYHYGYERIEEDIDALKSALGRLAIAATSRFEEDEEVKEAGLLVDLGGSVVSDWSKGAEVVDLIISELSINIVLILNSERAYSDLTRKHTTSSQGQETVHVIKLPPSGGAVHRPPSYLSQQQTLQIKQYFFGTSTLPLSPFTQSISTSPADCPLSVYATPHSETMDTLTASFLPGGYEAPTHSALEKVELNSGMERRLLVVKHCAAEAAIEEVRDASVMGWLYVVDVDEEKKRARVLCPMGGRLPGNACVLASWPSAFSGIVG